jgi:hypothetical protein
MAKAALMVEETEELEELEVPTGGIGDFVMEEDEARSRFTVMIPKSMPRMLKKSLATVA